MPKESFWDSSTAVDVKSDPVLTVGWGGNTPAVTLNNVEFDRSGINRLIATLVKARNATFGADADSNGRTVRVSLVADTADYIKAMEDAKKAVERLTEAAKHLPPDIGTEINY